MFEEMVISSPNPKKTNKPWTVVLSMLFQTAFFGFGLEITISSNMSPTSSRREQDVPGRFRYRGFCCRLRVRCLPPRPVLANDSRQRRAEQRYQNWSTFLPQSPTTRAKEKARSTWPPSGTGRARLRKVKPLVKIVRERVWLMDLLTTSANDSCAASGCFHECDRR